MATHSPLVVNELNPEEVSLVSRTMELGTRTRRLDTVPDMEQALSAFALGEYWLTFADGVLDEDVVQPALAADG